MDKFSELKSAAMAATPGPWEWFTSNSMARLSSTPSGKDGDVLSAFRASDGVPCVSVSQRDMAFIAAANPAVILALLAELEVKDERIGELEVIATEYAGKFQKAQDANKHLIIMSNDDKKRIAELERANQSQDDHINQQQDRIDSLEKTNAGLGRRLGDAEKRLATPVQLQNCDFESVAIMAHWCTDEQLKAWVKGVEHAKKQIRAAGFTVEGDE
ncbi:ead/Ea22-like family protein [Serratia ureilytica]|uniref:ead/Ea22-like family protein n=1 Tax=Serratia ureilytica TaxID=300181 RepID=UPI00384CDA56